MENRPDDDQAVGLRLFGVRIQLPPTDTDADAAEDALIRKSRSTGDLANAGASDHHQIAAAAEHHGGYVSDGGVGKHGNGSRKRGAGPAGAATSAGERRRGVPWTEDEHRTFLKGLEELGKGDWRGISKKYVTTRTPTQVASHAQKYFLRQTNPNKKKRRSSLFDVAINNNTTLSAVASTPAVTSTEPSMYPQGNIVQPQGNTAKVEHEQFPPVVDVVENQSPPLPTAAVEYQYPHRQLLLPFTQVYNTNDGFNLDGGNCSSSDHQHPNHLQQHCAPDFLGLSLSAASSSPLTSPAAAAPPLLLHTGDLELRIGLPQPPRFVVTNLPSSTSSGAIRVV